MVQYYTPVEAGKYMSYVRPPAHSARFKRYPTRSGYKDILNLELGVTKLPFLQGTFGAGKGGVGKVFRGLMIAKNLPSKIFYGAVGSIGALVGAGYLAETGKWKTVANPVRWFKRGQKLGGGEKEAKERATREWYANQQWMTPTPEGEGYYTPAGEQPFTPLPAPVPPAPVPPRGGGDGFIPRRDIPPINLPFTNTTTPQITIFGGGGTSDISQLALLGLLGLGVGGLAYYGLRRRRKKKKAKRRKKK